MIKKKKTLYYCIRTYDGRYNPGDKFTSFNAAVKEAKRLFGWKRIYTGRTTKTPSNKYWYPVEDNIEGIEISDKPSTVYRTDSPIIEKYFDY